MARKINKSIKSKAIGLQDAIGVLGFLCSGKTMFSGLIVK
jgi:hypothetical protein